jgi:UPF0755 protein
MNSKTKKAIFYVLSALVLLLLGASAYIVHEAYEFVYTPPEVPGSEKVVHISQGMTFDQVARMLEDEKVITDAEKFRLLGQWKEQLGNIKAGEFRLHTGWEPETVLAAVTSGKAVMHKFLIPPGLTWWQVAKLVDETGLTTYDKFVAAAFDKQLLAEYHIPWDSPEGFLYPETYFVPRPRDKAAEPIVRAMFQAFWDQAGAKLWPDLDPAEVPEDELKRLVILASMVEKETADPSERARIAGVYANRIEKRMLMQCDPTVIYGLGREFDGNLKRSHLRDKSNPYNTYVRTGLPPGPICSPGAEALVAAKKPEQHSYLYFVSKGDGSHYFSKNLAEHNRAVRKYQLKR